MPDSKDKKITLMINQSRLTFMVNIIAYNRCINSLQPENKTTPMFNFLQNCAADDETKKLVREYYEQGLAPDIFGVLIDEFKPDVEITVKK